MIPPEIIAEAKRQWADRELTFPKFVRQTWEQGTDLAKACLIARVARDSGIEARRGETAQPARSRSDESPGDARSAAIAQPSPSPPKGHP